MRNRDATLPRFQAGANASAGSGVPQAARKASLSARGRRLSAYSAFSAAERDGNCAAATMRSGGNARVKRAPRPAQWAA